MPRPEYFSLRVPAGTTERIRRLADPMGISVSEWIRRALKISATSGAMNTSGTGQESEFINVSRDRTLGWMQGVIRYAIATSLIDSERKAPRPPVIEPSEQQAAKGAIFTDSMEVE